MPTAASLDPARLAADWPLVLADLAAAEPALAKKVDVWLKPGKVRPVACADGVLDLECATGLFQSQIRTSLAGPLAAAASRRWSLPVEDVRCRVSRDAVQDHADRVAAATQATAASAPRPGHTGLGYKTLADFVVGPCNRLAHAAVMRLLDDPRTAASPLFIHGASGVGKTHLAQGLALAFRERYPTAQALYVRCEQFTNEFIDACADPKHALRAFRVRMRHPDLLLIDDLHFLGQGAKVRTKDELLATIEALHEQGKRVVITSDACPRDIKYLEERLVQRFSAGLVTALDRPDPAVRRDVLLRRARAVGLELPDAVVGWLVERFAENMRQIEGAVHALDAFRRGFDRGIDLAAARVALADLIGDHRDRSPIELVLREVAERYRVEVRDLRGRTRTRPVSAARQVALYVLKHASHDTYAAVGKALNIRSHASVAHACQHVAALRTADPALDAFIEDLVFRAGRQ